MANNTPPSASPYAALFSTDYAAEFYPFLTRKQQQRHEHRATLYAILLATEHLERAYIRDSVSSDEYERECHKLISQFHTTMALVTTEATEVGTGEFELDSFMREMDVGFCFCLYCLFTIV